MIPIIIFKSTTSLKRKITKKFPWREGSDEEVIEQIKQVDVMFPADIDPRASAVILKCMTKDPRNRPTVEDLLADPWFLKADNTESRKPRRMVKQSTTLNGNELLFNTWKKSVVIVKPRVSGMKSAIMKAPSMRGIRSWRFTGSDGEDYGGCRGRSYVSSSQSQQSIDSV